MRQKVHPIQRSWRRSMPLFRSFELAGLIWTFEHSGQRPRGRQKMESPTTGKCEGSSLTAAKEQAPPCEGADASSAGLKARGFAWQAGAPGPKLRMAPVLTTPPRRDGQNSRHLQTPFQRNPLKALSRMVRSCKTPGGQGLKERAVNRASLVRARMHVRMRFPMCQIYKWWRF